MRTRFALICWIALCSAALLAQTNSAPDAATIVAHLGQSEARRNQQLAAYTSLREYHLISTGFFGQREADMTVHVTSHFGVKHFTIVSSSGSHFIIEHVFHKLLETEQETSGHPERVALNESNYNFELLGNDDVSGRPAYVLQVTPKKNEKYLYRGKIWVDAADYAVTRIQAEPAKRPSFWIGSAMISHRYEKVGEFWLPVEDNSQSDIRWGGHADLSIHYGQYNITPVPLAAEILAPGTP